MLSHQYLNHDLELRVRVLAQIAANIPNQASAAGLAIIPGVDIIRETDVRIHPFEAEVGDALRVAVMANAPFITV